jgi:hypothetical protein
MSGNIIHFNQMAKLINILYFNLLNQILGFINI